MSRRNRQKPSTSAEHPPVSICGNGDSNEIADYARDIADAVLAGEVSDRNALQRLKIALCEKYGLRTTPSNPDILSELPDDVRERVKGTLRLKPVRSLSGVAVVAVMANPASCPHGKCICCPGGPEFGTAQSYTGYEPAARRAIANEFDPYRQVRNRLDQLTEIGHPTDKIDLIVMGGTFPARDNVYQENFILRCFDAMNGFEASSIAEAHVRNETAPARCIGLTVETRPDQFSNDQIEFLMRLGMTRVELGVQSVYDEHLDRMRRGHTVDASIDATSRAKKNGLKVCYHMMPGLPGSDLETDIEMFRTAFDDPRFKPDMLKIYPTLVVRGTELYEIWKRGEFEPPDTDYIVRLLLEIKRFVPEWVRIQRIQRDIPLHEIEAGATKSNARQLARTKLAEMGRRCRCIRCREIGHSSERTTDETNLELKEMEYTASGGEERFIEIVNKPIDALIGFARLRLDFEEDSEANATLRELRVYGQQVPIDDRIPGAHQHRGYGGQLIERCEEISIAEGAKRLRITSGIGVREYYRKFGYELDGFHMAKRLPSRQEIKSVDF